MHFSLFKVLKQIRITLPLVATALKQILQCAVCCSKSDVIKPNRFHATEETVSFLGTSFSLLVAI